MPSTPHAATCVLAAALLAAGCASTRPRSTARPTLGSADNPTMLFGTMSVVDTPAAGRSPRTAPRTPSAAGGSTIAVATDSRGQVVTSGDFRGKVVVLDFWATWCGPCKASSPAFQQLADRFAGDPRVMTLAIHTDNTGDPRAYMREHGYTFRMVPRGQEFAAAYGVNVLPTFIVLDERGREIYRDTGMMGDSQRAAVERLVRGALR